MKEIIVKIPDGDFCEGCEFLNWYTHNLVNIFGDPTGNVKEGYECKHYKIDLEIDKTCCCERPKKCWACTATDEEKTIGAMLLLVGMKLMEEGNQNESQNPAHERAEENSQTRDSSHP